MSSKRPASARAMSRSRSWLASTESGRALVSSRGQPRHPLRRLPQDFQGDVSAHGEPGEGKTLGRLPQQAGGDGRDRIIPGVIRDQDGALRRQGGDLRLEEAGGAGQTGNQNECFGHQSSSCPWQVPWIDKPIAYLMVPPLLNLSKNLR